VARLGELATTQLGKMLSKKAKTGVDEQPYLRNQNVQWGRFDLSDVASMAFSPEERQKFALQDGDVLVCEGGIIGRASVWRRPGTMYFQKALHRVRCADGVLPEYVAYALRHMSWENMFGEHSGGSTISHLTQVDLRRLPLPLPPAQEQVRVVAEIERRFSHIDAAQRSLSRTVPLARRARAAIERELIWQERFQLRPLGDLLESGPSNGRSVQTREGGFPVLRLTCLDGHGAIDLNQHKEGDWSRADAERFLVRDGDFLLSRGNGSLRLVGRGGLVRAPSLEVAFPDTLVRVRADQSKLLPEFLNAAWASQGVRQQIESVARTTAGIYKINQKHIADVRIPVPSPEEQATLANELERRLSFIQAAVRSTSGVRVSAERVRRGVLADAFAGRLVPQDPTDEPATQLLERIQITKASVPSQSARRRPAKETVK